MRAAIERLATLIRRRLARDTQGENDFSIQGALSHRMIAIIAQKNCFVGAYRGAVSPFKNALSPRAQKVSIPVEDDDRMRAAGEAINLIFFIHRDRRHFLKGPALPQLPPALDDFVAKFSAPNDYAHTNLLVFSQFRVLSLELNRNLKTRNYSPVSCS